MYLFFDTETTGVPKNYKAPPSDLLNWPRVVQLGWIVTDMQGRELKATNHIIRPDGSPSHSFPYLTKCYLFVAHQISYSQAYYLFIQHA